MGRLSLSNSEYQKLNGRIEERPKNIFAKELVGIPHFLQSVNYHIAKQLCGFTRLQEIEVLEYGDGEIHFYCDKMNEELVGFLIQKPHGVELGIKLRFTEHVITDKFLDFYE